MSKKGREEKLINVHDDEKTSSYETGIIPSYADVVENNEIVEFALFENLEERERAEDNRQKLQEFHDDESRETCMLSSMSRAHGFADPLPVYHDPEENARDEDVVIDEQQHSLIQIVGLSIAFPTSTTHKQTLKQQLKQNAGAGDDVTIHISPYHQNQANTVKLSKRIHMRCLSGIYLIYKRFIRYMRRLFHLLHFSDKNKERQFVVFNNKRDYEGASAMILSVAGAIFYYLTAYWRPQVWAFRIIIPLMSICTIARIWLSVYRRVKVRQLNEAIAELENDTKDRTPRTTDEAIKLAVQVANEDSFPTASAKYREKMNEEKENEFAKGKIKSLKEDVASLEYIVAIWLERLVFILIALNNIIVFLSYPNKQFCVNFNDPIPGRDCRESFWLWPGVYGAMLLYVFVTLPRIMPVTGPLVASHTLLYVFGRWINIENDTTEVYIAQTALGACICVVALTFLIKSEEMRREMFITADRCNRYAKQILDLQMRQWRHIGSLVNPEMVRRISDVNGCINFDIKGTVVFTRMANFTRWCTERSGSEIAASINALFSDLDKISAKMHVTHALTFGDIYVTVIGIGIHTTPQENAEGGCLFAAEISKGRRDTLRIIISSGTVVGTVDVQPIRYQLAGNAFDTGMSLMLEMEDSGSILCPVTVQLTGCRILSSVTEQIEEADYDENRSHQMLYSNITAEEIETYKLLCGDRFFVYSNLQERLKATREAHLRKHLFSGSLHFRDNDIEECFVRDVSIRVIRSSAVVAGSIFVSALSIVIFFLMFFDTFFYHSSFFIFSICLLVISATGGVFMLFCVRKLKIDRALFLYFPLMIAFESSVCFAPPGIWNNNLQVWSIVLLLIAYMLLPSGVMSTPKWMIANGIFVSGTLTVASVVLDNFAVVSTAMFHWIALLFLSYMHWSQDYSTRARFLHIILNYFLAKSLQAETLVMRQQLQLPTQALPVLDRCSSVEIPTLKKDEVDPLDMYSGGGRLKILDLEIAEMTAVPQGIDETAILVLKLVDGRDVASYFGQRVRKEKNSLTSLFLQRLCYAVCDEAIAEFGAGKVYKAKVFGDMVLLATVRDSLEAVGCLACVAQAFLVRMSEHRREIVCTCTLTAGPIAAALTGENHLSFEMFGDTLTTAIRVLFAAPPGSITISDRYAFLYNCWCDEQLEMWYIDEDEEEDDEEDNEGEEKKEDKGGEEKEGNDQDRNSSLEEVDTASGEKKRNVVRSKSKKNNNQNPEEEFYPPLILHNAMPWKIKGRGVVSIRYASITLPVKKLSDGDK